MGKRTQTAEVQLARMIERMPRQLRAELRDAVDRLLAIRSPKQAVQALEAEYEHALRYMLPVVIEHPKLRRAGSAAAFAAGFAALAAATEEADELLTLFSAGTLTAPGTSVVVAVGLLAAAAETYAAASVRVHQLRECGCDIDAVQLAADVRRAVLGETDASPGGLSVAKRLADGAAGRLATRGTGRLTTRWAVGAVPIVGIGYAAFDSSRTIRDVLRTPLPTVARPMLAPVNDLSERPSRTERPE